MLQTPSEPRIKKRVPCHISVDGRSYSGMVLNVSRGGLFVQTTVGPQPGQDVRLQLNMDRDDGIPIGARVVWRRVVAPHLRTVSTGGIGVRIESAPESYFNLLEGVNGESRVPRKPESTGPQPPLAAEAEPAQDAPRYRIRLKQAGGPRSRTLEIRGASEDEACQAALAGAGEGWQVLEVRCID